MEVSKAKRSFNMKLQKAQATRDLRRHPSSTAAISECEPHPPEGRPDHGDPEPATSDHKEPLPPSHADRCTRCQTSLAIGASPHLRQPRHYKTYVWATAPRRGRRNNREAGRGTAPMPMASGFPVSWRRIEAVVSRRRADSAVRCQLPAVSHLGPSELAPFACLTSGRYEMITFTTLD
jgi:hypothetical protein